MSQPDTPETTPLDASWYSEEAATFGDRIVAGRESIGLTQEQLARRLGVKLQTVRNWESDRSEPRANKLQMLAGLLNVSMIWLMSGQGEGITNDEEGSPADLRSSLLELREIRNQHVLLTERLARLEKRLRNQVG
jgi:transcriptional regulator with XRE-family HTH domain